MGNKKTLSIKLNKSFQSQQDAPFTPVEQTLQTPVDLPNQNSYFLMPSSSSKSESSFFSQTQENDSDDVMTDVDEPSSSSLPKTIRNYSISFTAAFDQILMNIYSHILSLPTTTPFSGHIPPSGLASRVANETFLKMIADSDPSTNSGDISYDTQGSLNHEQLRNAATTHIVLQLIRKRLLDLCGAQRAPKQKTGPSLAGTSTSISVAVPLNSGAQNNSVYGGSGLRQSSISTLSLNEHNSALFQQGLAGSRSRSSSLNLRKHSLTRNNSATGASWLHVGNLSNIRSGGYGSNQDYAGSTDSLQSMNDFVPHQFLTRSASTSSNASHNAISAPGFNSLMMDYYTPPTSSKGSISYGSTTPPTSTREEACFTLPESTGSYSDSESSAPVFLGARSLSRGNGCSFPKPLTINTDVASHNFGNTQCFSEALHSPFVSAVAPSEDTEYFGRNSTPTGSVLENANVSARSISSNSDSSAKDMTESRPSLSQQFSLSEKKRDSLKLKRGIL